MSDAHGRDIAVNDQSNRTIFKDACLWGYQDTYVSNNQNGKFYFEGGVIRGRTDYMCGKGDVYYNKVTLRQVASGYAAVPSLPKKYGYIYQSCKIVGDTDSGVDGKYTLGRPWGKGTPIALFIDTEMEVKPSAIGWNEMSGGWPARFAEYGSHTTSGAAIDLSGRKTTFADTHENNPILTAEEAAEPTLAAVMGQDDDWQPTLLTEQAPVPTGLDTNGTQLTWDDSNYALLWAVCKNGQIIDFTTEPAYTITEEGVYSVRAANEMGGLSAKSTSIVLKRSIAADKWSTIVVPFAMDATQVTTTFGSSVKVAELTSGDASNLNFTTVTAMEANKPYAIKVASDFTAAAISDVTIAEATPTQTVGDWQFIGTYASKAIPQGSYFFSNNKLYKAADDSNTINPFRAYFTYTGTSSAPSITFTVDGETTGIADVRSKMEDGRSEYYNLNGQRVDTPAKGVYIVNGRKVIIK
jgi:hypothetical protein